MKTKKLSSEQPKIKTNSIEIKDTSKHHIKESKELIKYDIETSDPTREDQKELSKFEKDYRYARSLFDNEEYPDCAKSIQKLYRGILVNIIDKLHRKLSGSVKAGDRFLKTLLKITSDNKKDLKEVNLRDICALFDDPEVDFFLNAGETYNDYLSLLKSYNFQQISDLINDAIQSNEKSEYIILGLQQALTLITVLLKVRMEETFEINKYHLLVNYEHIKSELDRIKALSLHKITKTKSTLHYIDEEEKDKKEGKREFQWIKYRGTLVNPTDNSRNIAFKVETFVNILSTIYEGMSREILAVEKNIKEESVENLARILPKKILLESGYESGSSFGWTMQEILRKEFTGVSLKTENITIAHKIQKWCEFDSDVGFGKLSLKNFDEKDVDEHTIYKFSIQLIDNFMVFKRDQYQANLNSFMSGYIKGVLERILQQPLIIKHNPWEHSQQFRANDYCIFYLETNIEELKENLRRAEMLYSDDLNT